jgi:hypothetical protein
MLVTVATKETAYRVHILMTDRQATERCVMKDLPMRRSVNISES